VGRDGSRYDLTKNARRWLDPASNTYMGTFIQDCGEYWDWWSQLEDIVRTGKSIGLHDRPPEDPGWQTYIRGQFELARLSAPEVAKALRLPTEPTALLDVAGGHGWFSAELCRRHPGLKATSRCDCVEGREGCGTVRRVLILFNKLDMDPLGLNAFFR
jgi:hypothetical protein